MPSLTPTRPARRWLHSAGALKCHQDSEQVAGSVCLEAGTGQGAAWWGLVRTPLGRTRGLLPVTSCGRRGWELSGVSSEKGTNPKQEGPASQRSHLLTPSRWGWFQHVSLGHPACSAPPLQKSSSYLTSAMDQKGKTRSQPSLAAGDKAASLVLGGRVWFLPLVSWEARLCQTLPDHSPL